MLVLWHFPLCEMFAETYVSVWCLHLADGAQGLRSDLFCADQKLCAAFNEEILSECIRAGTNPSHHRSTVKLVLLIVVRPALFTVIGPLVALTGGQR
jgi:hypothetical protein